MLSRFVSKPSHCRLVALVSSRALAPTPKPHSPTTSHPPFLIPSSFNSCPSSFQCFSSNRDKDNPNSPSNLWNLSTQNDQQSDSIFADTDDLANSGEESWASELKEKEGDVFRGIDGEKEIGMTSGVEDEWKTGEGFKEWSFVVDGEKDEDVFGIGEAVEADITGLDGAGKVEREKSEEEKKLELEEKTLTAVLKGPDRAFGDLIVASGITDGMLDSLMALKDLSDVPGLPPLSEIEDMRYEKNTRRSTRAEIELQKQEEITKSRVRQVDEKGRAYGTGKRKCSIARVWIQPGDGKFLVNDKQFDVYFPMLDQRAALLRPLSETNTLGLMDVKCTVKGGGMSGQVGAIRLGISRALQNWAPDQFRPPLREAGFLTRDSRVVERKKPGKAKARKSFQWVKR